MSSSLPRESESSRQESTFRMTDLRSSLSDGERDRMLRSRGRFIMESCMVIRPATNYGTSWTRCSCGAGLSRTEEISEFLRHASIAVVTSLKQFMHSLSGRLVGRFMRSRTEERKVDQQSRTDRRGIISGRFLSTFSDLLRSRSKSWRSLE